MNRLAKFGVALLMLSGSTLAQECDGLPAWYAGYNETYFNTTLPKDTKVGYGDAGGAMAVTRTTDGRHFEIILDRTYNKSARVAHTVLLHEMCHIETWSEVEEHGHKFIGCMRATYRAGAFQAIWIDAYSPEPKKLVMMP